MNNIVTLCSNIIKSVLKMSGYRIISKPSNIILKKQYHAGVSRIAAVPFGTSALIAIWVRLHHPNKGKI